MYIHSGGAGYNNSLLNPLLGNRSVIHQLPTGQRLFHYDHTQLQPNPQFQYNNAALIAPHSPVRQMNPEQEQQEREIGEALLALSPMTSRTNAVNNTLTSSNIPLFDTTAMNNSNTNANTDSNAYNNSSSTKLI